MSAAPILVAVLLAACGGEDAGARSESSAGTERGPGEPGVAGAPAAVRDFCGSPDEARIRAAHPELPPCMSRAYTYVEARVGGHALLVLAHEADPCCTDVPSPATDAGAHVFVDGAARPASDPIAVGAAPRDEAEAMGLLTAELLRLRVVRPIVDAAGGAALRAAWPAAGPAIAAHPPGLARAGAGWRLRALAESREIERGIDCRGLAAWEVDVDAAGVRARRTAAYATGTAMGAPCPGDPLPR